MKSKSICLAFLFVVTIILVGCELSINTSNEAKKPDLVLTLSLDNAVYQPGEKIFVSISLTNIGARDTLVNKRMAFDVPQPFGEIMFTITEPSGEIVPSYTTFHSLSLVEPKDFVFLSSRETIEAIYEIESLYDLKAGKSYSIFAVYQNTLDPNKYITAWKGELKSNVVVFEITP